MPFRSESRDRKEAPQRWERCKNAKTKARQMHLYERFIWHIVKHGVEWTGVDWSGFVKHGVDL